jgi:DNA polymerase-3 subunit epsilon
MKPQIFAFLDTETTGLDASKHELIEVAGIVVKIVDPKDEANYEILEEFVYKIKPERLSDADPVSLKINHYDPSKWMDAVSLREAMEAVSEKTEGAVMIAHNVSFDTAFLDKAFRDTEVENKMHYHRMDTVSMAYALLRNNPDVNSLSLRALCQYFSIPQENAHEALSDVRALLELYKKLMSL